MNLVKQIDLELEDLEIKRRVLDLKRKQLALQTKEHELQPAPQQVSASSAAEAAGKAKEKDATTEKRESKQDDDNAEEGDDGEKAKKANIAMTKIEKKKGLCEVCLFFFQKFIIGQIKLQPKRVKNRRSTNERHVLKFNRFVQIE